MNSINVEVSSFDIDVMMQNMGSNLISLFFVCKFWSNFKPKINRFASKIDHGQIKVEDGT